MQHTERFPGEGPQIHPIIFFVLLAIAIAAVLLAGGWIGLKMLEPVAPFTY